MPRYLNINSKFEPFSFQEKIAPLLMYKEEYDKVIDEYTKALESSNVLEIMGYSDVDRDAYDLYKYEEQELQNAMDNFINIGYNINSRKDLWKAKERMNNLVVPMQAAYNRKLELIKEADSNKDKSLEYYEDPHDVKVTTLMENMGWSPTSFSKDDLINKGALISSGSSDLLLHGVGNYSSAADNKVLQRIQTQGFSDEDSIIIEGILKGVEGIENYASSIHYRAANALNDIIENTGVKNWEDGEVKNAAINKAINSVMAGFNSKLGKETIHSMANPGYKKPSNDYDPENPNISYSRPGIANIEGDTSMNDALHIINSYIEGLKGKDAKLESLGSGKVRVNLGEDLKGWSRIIENPFLDNIIKENPGITLKELKGKLNEYDIIRYNVPIELNTNNSGSLYVANNILAGINNSNINLINIKNSKGKEVKIITKNDVINSIKNNKAVTNIQMHPLSGKLSINVQPEESKESYVIELDDSVLNTLMPNMGYILSAIKNSTNNLNNLYKAGQDFTSEDSVKAQKNVKDLTEVFYGSLLDPLYGDTKPIR